MAKALHDLTETFQKLGASDPETWASSQLNESIPQLHRFLFLKQMWELVASEDDDSWLERTVAAFRKKPDEPFAGAGRAIERMLEKNVSRADIVDLVRASQAELLTGVCYRLSDPSLSTEAVGIAGDLGWALVTVDDEYEPTSQVLGGLHESVLSEDPTGREMRPRDEQH